MKRVQLIISMSLVSIGVFVFGYYIYQQFSPSGQTIRQEQLQQALYMADSSKPLVEVELVDHNKKPFNLSRLKGQWSIIYFGYAHCPDICPTDLMLLNNVYQHLQKQQVLLPKVYFVTLDPNRDKVDLLKDYTPYFNPNFIGVTGEKAAIDQFIRPFGTYYELTYPNAKNPVKDASEIPEAYQKNYLVNHTAWIYLINPQPKIHIAFPTPHGFDEITADLTSVLQNAD